jgi:hypothetical protein
MAFQLVAGRRILLFLERTTSWQRGKSGRKRLAEVKSGCSSDRYQSYQISGSVVPVRSGRNWRWGETGEQLRWSRFGSFGYFRPFLRWRPSTSTFSLSLTSIMYLKPRSYREKWKSFRCMNLAAGFPTASECTVKLTSTPPPRLVAPSSPKGHTVTRCKIWPNGSLYQIECFRRYHEPGRQEYDWINWLWKNPQGMRFKVSTFL